MLTLFPIVCLYTRLNLVYRRHLDGHRDTSLSYFLFLSGTRNEVLSGLECVCVTRRQESNAPSLISQHPVQSAGGAATLSLSSQSLHLHIVLTRPRTGRHLLESAANTTCEKNQAGRNSFPIPTATCWLSFGALGKNGAKQQALDAEDTEPLPASLGSQRTRGNYRISSTLF